MSTAAETTSADTEASDGGRASRRRRKPSLACSSETITDRSLCFTDSEDGQSWHSPLNSTGCGSYEECRFSEIEGVSGSQNRQKFPVSDDCSLDEEVDLESGELEIRVHSAKEERDCRICHLTLMRVASDQECMEAIELGCSCKGDLGIAHKHCAETWFKIRGNTTCEICGATALNVASEHPAEENNASEIATAAPPAISGTRNVWHGRRLMNFLLACMIFAFVISWLFHFNILP